MAMGPLHRLADMISKHEAISDEDLLDTLGRDGTIVVPTKGGGERLLPSGEILSVLADSAGRSIEDVLATNFRLAPEEIAAASDFMRLVQFTGDGQISQDAEQPLQPLDH